MTGRIRTVKPEFFRSPDTAATSFAGRIFYQALWCWADDFGIGETNINGLLGFAFPDDDLLPDPVPGELRAISAQDVRRFCAEVARNYDVAFYTVRNRHYYAIKTWSDHQKLEKRSERRKHPAPDHPEAVIDQRFYGGAELAPKHPRESGANPAPFPAGTGEQGTGEREQGNQPSPSSVRNSPARQPGSRREAALVALTDTAHSQPAHRIALAYQDWLGSAVDSKTLGEVAVVVDELLNDAIPPEQIAGGIKAWHASDAWAPSQIRRFVNKAARRPDDGVGTPTRKATSHLTVAEQIIAEMSAS